MYFRSFGFKPAGSTQSVAWGTPAELPDEICVTTEVTISTWGKSVELGTMRYLHTHKTRDAVMLMYVNEDGFPNEVVVGQMARDPSDPEYPENQQCKDLGWWRGIHVHEYHIDGAGTFFLRDNGGQCAPTYPCGEQFEP